MQLQNVHIRNVSFLLIQYFTPGSFEATCSVSATVETWQQSMTLQRPGVAAGCW